MKKIILLIALLFIPVMVNAAQCDTSKVYIKSIEKGTITGEVEEKTEATAKDKSINLDLKMNAVNDNIQYKVLLVNESDEDYILDKNSLSVGNEYFNYSFETNNSNVIKAKSSKELILNVQYKKEVPSAMFEGNVYRDNNSMQLNLNSEERIPNPNTGLKYGLIVLIILLIPVLFLVIRKTNQRKLLLVLISLGLLIPFSVKAICSCSIKIDAAIEIEKPLPEFCFNNTDYDVDTGIFSGNATCKYEEGMTWEEFLSSGNDWGLVSSFNGEIIFYPSENVCSGNFVDGDGNEVLMTDKIKPCSETTYEKVVYPC